MYHYNKVIMLLGSTLLCCIFSLVRQWQEPAQPTQNINGQCETRRVVMVSDGDKGRIPTVLGFPDHKIFLHRAHSQLYGGVKSN